MLFTVCVCMSVNRAMCVCVCGCTVHKSVLCIDSDYHEHIRIVFFRADAFLFSPLVLKSILYL